MMKLLKLFFLTSLLVQWIGIPLTAKAVLVHNSLKEIESCKGKVQLKLIRIWGGDDEQDENKFFKLPTSIAISPAREVYILDGNENCIKVFDINGRYLRTLSQRGTGPGDLNQPQHLTFAPNGDLLVSDQFGLTIQRFSPTGKSKSIIKNKHRLSWIGVTSKEEIVTFGGGQSYISRKLFKTLDKNGKVIREFGKYDDAAKESMAAEDLKMSKDGNDNLYATYENTPLILKYAPNGTLIMGISYGTPFNIPGEIVLNSTLDEIIKKDRGVTIEIKKLGPSSVNMSSLNIVYGIAADSQNRIFIVARKRLLTDIEKKGLSLTIMNGNVDRKKVDYNVSEVIDVNRLIVFSPNGKVIGEAQLHSFCDGIYIYNNRLFIIDGVYNQRILEYEVSFSK